MHRLYAIDINLSIKVLDKKFYKVWGGRIKVAIFRGKKVLSIHREHLDITLLPLNICKFGKKICIIGHIS